MQLPFTDWSVLVTGGAVRIGREISRAFARHGARVVVHCNRSRPEAEALVREMPTRGEPHIIVCGDLTDRPFRQGLLSSLADQGICPDCLVNNASTYRRMPLLEANEPQFREDFEINFFVPFLLMQDYARHVGHGCIINLLDHRIDMVDPGAGGYGLAKKALARATEAAALEWAPDIRVNAVAPGYSLPPPGAKPGKKDPLLKTIPMQEPSRPPEVAAACVFLAQSTAITGHTIFVDGGMHLTPPGRRK